MHIYITNLCCTHDTDLNWAFALQKMRGNKLLMFRLKQLCKMESTRNHHISQHHLVMFSRATNTLIIGLMSQLMHTL